MKHTRFANRDRDTSGGPSNRHIDKDYEKRWRPISPADGGCRWGQQGTGSKGWLPDYATDAVSNGKETHKAGCRESGISIESKLFKFRLGTNLQIEESKGGIISTIQLDLITSLWLKESFHEFRFGKRTSKRYESLEISFGENRFCKYLKLIDNANHFNILIVPEGREGNGWAMFEDELHRSTEALGKQSRLVFEHNMDGEGASGYGGSLDFEFGLNTIESHDPEPSISTHLLHIDLEHLSAWVPKDPMTHEKVGSEGNDDQYYVLNYVIDDLILKVKNKIENCFPDSEVAEGFMNTVFNRVVCEHGFWKHLNDLVRSTKVLGITDISMDENGEIVVKKKMITRQQNRSQ